MSEDIVAVECPELEKIAEQAYRIAPKKFIFLKELGQIPALLLSSDGGGTRGTIFGEGYKPRSERTLAHCGSQVMTFSIWSQTATSRRYVDSAYFGKGSETLVREFLWRTVHQTPSKKVAPKTLAKMVTSRLKAALERQRVLRQSVLATIQEMEVKLADERKLLLDLDLDLENSPCAAVSYWADQLKGERGSVIGGGGDPFQKLVDCLALTDVTEETIKEARAVCMVSEIMES